MRIGSARAEDFDVPSEGGTFSVAEPTRGRRNGGTVLLSVGGGVALISGLIVLAASAAASEETPYGDTTTQTDDGSGTAKTVGTVGLVMGIGSVVAGVAMLLSSDMTPIRPAQDAGLEKQASKIKVRPTAGFDTKSGFLGVAGAF
jgi:predicted porin